MHEMISGIQQVGIGVSDANEAKYFYKQNFGMDVKIFDDRAEAALMTKYTGNTVHARHAILSMNMSGGGGFEIWQFTTRAPSLPGKKIQFGDPGIFAAKIKARDVNEAHDYFTQQGFRLSKIEKGHDNRFTFWLQDLSGNYFNIVEGSDWFKTKKVHCGGVVGAVIGVSNMEKALQFYKEMLGISEEVYNKIDTDFTIPGGGDEQSYHRVLLRKKASKHGAFSKLLGGIEIELVQVMDSSPAHIFEKRYWGDCGFIHLCFDVPDMDSLKRKAEAAGYPFSVDSKDSYAMETSSGRFCYLEDPDGTLIELVETHKVPVFKKFGLYIDLKNRKKNKPLPYWMVSLLALSKIK